MTHGRTIIGVIGLQAALVGLWFLIEDRRSTPPPVAAVQTRVLDVPAPPLTLLGRESSTRLAAIEGPIVLHVWASWCPPCRAELPGLLAFADAHAAPVLTVSVDDGWAPIDAILGARRGAGAMRATSEDVKGFGVERLPVTFVLDRDHRLRLRLDGPRDWRDAAVIDQVQRALAQPTSGAP